MSEFEAVSVDIVYRSLSTTVGYILHRCRLDVVDIRNWSSETI